MIKVNPVNKYSPILMLYAHLQHHNDTIIKTQEDFFNKICTSQSIARVRKGLLKVCVRPNRNCNILTPNLWPSTLCLSRSPDAQPEALGSTLLGAGFLYCILSASSLDPNSSGPQAPSAWCGFPYHNSSLHLALELTGTGTQLCYIIVPRPLDRPLDL